ncbi:hypothetical protein ACHAXS_006112 [Conticribra weissflogii]
MTAQVAFSTAFSPPNAKPTANKPAAPPPSNLEDPSNVRRWLQSNHPKQLALLDQFEIELRLGRYSSASDTTTAVDDPAAPSSSSSSSKHQTYQYGRQRRILTTRTLELLRAIIGPSRWKTAAQLLTLLRGLGNELHAAGGYREPAIGNMVRRIMFAVRDEADRVPVGGGDDDDGAVMGKIDELSEGIATKLDLEPARRSLGREHSLSSMLWAHPQHVLMKHSKQTAGESGGLSGLGDRLRSDSVGSDSGVCGGGFGDNASAGCDAGAGTAASYPPHYYQRRDDLRQSVMEAIQEMMSELEDLHKNINEQATQHIHAGEIILTYALSKTVGLFLKAAAAKKRKFQVIVCEGAPHFGGHAMAKELAEAGIDTTVIHDAATFAIMARVNKVLLPAHAVLVSDSCSCYRRCRFNSCQFLFFGVWEHLFGIREASCFREFSVEHCAGLTALDVTVRYISIPFFMLTCIQLPPIIDTTPINNPNNHQANGGLIAPSGSNMVALAAKQNSVPVVAVAGMFKLCPMYPHEGQDTLNDLISPSAVVDYSLMGDPVLSEVEFVNPVHDYIKPELIDLYVTNIGGFQPSYIYRLLAEYYHGDDWEAFE